MNKFLKTFGITSAAAFALALSAQAQTTNYAGNGATGFGGPFGNGMLTFSSDGTTVSGTITPGNNVSATTGQLYDEAVIYIDSQAGGFTDTSTFTAALTNGNIDYLQQAAAGTNGTVRATLDYAAGFGADYVIALSPTQAQFGALYSITSTGGLNFLQSINLDQTGKVGPYSFNFTLANIGSPTSFNFSTTYINAHVDANGNEAYRSNEAIGNTITDVTNPANTNNVGQDTGLVGFSTFAAVATVVPEPSTWAMLLGGVGMLVAFQRRLRRQA